jgi:hypothetical protein
VFRKQAPAGSDCAVAGTSPRSSDNAIGTLVRVRNELRAGTIGEGSALEELALSEEPDGDIEAAGGGGATAEELSIEGFGGMGVAK